MKRENVFQARIIKRLETEFPGSLVLKNDPNYIQGIPDLSIFHKNRWAMLECKRSINEPRQPNQEDYIEQTNEMSFARFIYPENEEEVINELRQLFETEGAARIS